MRNQGDSSNDGAPDELALPNETLENDEEIKLHVMGLHSYYTQRQPQTKIISRSR